MFSTCIHCSNSLGHNEALERFPVGKRLAFDPQKGRLWVVCPACERWNLSPLDERWEVIEDAERRFRDARLRVSTDEIGLARLREGLDLIRIGLPQRPEMAAWRYGDQFGRRRKRQLLITGAAVGAAASVMGAIAFVGATAGAFAGIYGNPAIWDSLIHGSPDKVVARLMGPDGQPLLIKRRHARMSAIEQDDAEQFRPSTALRSLGNSTFATRSETPARFRLRLEHAGGTKILYGEAAMRAAAQLLPAVNRFGGSGKKVQEAVGLLEEAGNPIGVLLNAQSQFGFNIGEKRPTYSKKGIVPIQKVPGALHTLPLTQRLALEMALHEESERRAMDGELTELERAWREAEEVAKIADDMFVTSAVNDRLAELQHGRDANADPESEG